MRANAALRRDTRFISLEQALLPQADGLFDVQSQHMRVPPNDPMATELGTMQPRRDAALARTLRALDDRVELEGRTLRNVARLRLPATIVGGIDDGRERAEPAVASF